MGSVLVLGLCSDLGLGLGLGLILSGVAGEKAETGAGAEAKVGT